MFTEFFRFEIKAMLSRPMVYIFFIINFLLIFTAATNDNITIGNGLGNVHVNSPFSVMSYSVFMSLLSVIMTTAFMNISALKDFTHKFHSILFSKPISKAAYYFGRFSSSVIVSIIALLGVLVAILCTGFITVSNPENIGPTYLGAYVNSLILFIIPNTIIIGAFIYALATRFRSTAASFVGAIVLLMAYLMAGNYTNNLDNESLAILLDPFGVHALSLITKYWTLDEKNTIYLAINGPILLNRILWLAVAGTLIFLSYFTFSFTPKNKNKNKTLSLSPKLEPSNKTLNKLSPVNTSYRNIDNINIWWSHVKTEFWETVKSTPFIIITFFAIFNMLNSILRADQYFGVGNHPVSYFVIESIQNSLYIFLIVLISYYGGVSIWKERSIKINEIIHVAPYPTWLPALSKYTSLAGIIALILILSIFLGISAQAMKGYTNFELGLYVKQLLLIDLAKFSVLITAAFLVHVLVNNLYLGFFLFIVLIILNTFGWGALDINSNLINFTSTPSFAYSDMSKFIPFAKGVTAYSIYWLLFGGILLATSILFWIRGKNLKLKDRLTIAKYRTKSKVGLVAIGMTLMWISTGSFLYYNDEIINDNISEEQEENDVMKSCTRNLQTYHNRKLYL